MQAVTLDYLTRGQYVMCKRKKQTRKGAPRYGLTHARNQIHDIVVGPLYGQNRSNQSPLQLFQCRQEGLLPETTLKRLGGRLEHHSLFRSRHYSTSRLSDQNSLILP